MTKTHSHHVILQLLGDELSDTEMNPFATLDQVVGAVIFEVMALASPKTGRTAEENPELILEHLVRIATHAVRGAADLGIASTEEGR